ncbi:glycosyltransferase family 2 protein [Halomonas sp. SpR8]|uniref:glycosyltransferase family 2 protein n=1 Tax=Halomonas sp. SpR8 TaxID=3050463 RepID=UPI0027E48F6C|nr:glycosyltransferase family 2 protein [Halomonas sp. SpR8]MDQ7727295.1 glycosyltransferase family 2 protein [Halomonas sp. SpR8]
MRQHIASYKDKLATVFNNEIPAFWRRKSLLRVEQAQPLDSAIALEASTHCVTVGEKPWPGWNMLEIDGLGGDAHGAATVFIHTANRIIESSVSLRPGKVTKRILWVPMGVKKVSLSFLASVSALAEATVEWVWLTPWFAHDRLARRLINNHANYKGMRLSQAVRSLHVESVAQARRWRTLALADYDQTHAKQHVDDDYTRWVATTEKAANEDPARVIADLKSAPLFSLVMPVTLADLEHGEAPFLDTISSLKAQSYFFWEIYIVLSADISDEQRQSLERSIPATSRINVIHSYHREFAHLDLQGFVQTQGDGVMRISVGDQLAHEALCKLAKAWNNYPEAQLFYADEDFLRADGERCYPAFKPDWNPDLLLSTNYIGRVALYKRRLLWQLEAEQSELLGSLTNAAAVDYALALTFFMWHSIYGTPHSVCHLPLMLYHRGTALPRPLLQNDAVKLVQNVLAQHVSSVEANVRPGLTATSVRIEWPIPSPEPLVSLLVPTRNGVDILRPCVDAILERTSYQHFELLILDNESDCPETLSYMAEVEKRDSRVRVLRWNYPFNYSAINNFGAAESRGSIIGLINNDVEPVNEHWLTEMVSQVSRAEIGCVGAKLYYPNGMLQHGGVILGLGDVAGHAHRFFPRHSEGYTGRLKLVQNLSAVTAACLLLRKSVFDNVGGLNEADLRIAYNDVDLCLKVREAGYRNLWSPFAELYHHESISRGADDTPSKRARWLSEVKYMRRTWAKQLDHDPAYNPNLTLVHEDFSLR